MTATLLGGLSYGRLERDARDRFERWGWYGAAALEWAPWPNDALVLSGAVRLEGAGDAHPEAAPRTGVRAQPLQWLGLFANLG